MDWVATGVALVALLVVPLVVLTLFSTPQRFRPLLAVLQGTAQLGALSLVLTGIIADIRWVSVALLVMMTAAIVVASRRIGFGRTGVIAAAVSIVGGCLLTGVIVFGTGAIDFTPRYLLAFAGILIGNAMTVVTLTGRGFRSAAISQWDEIEGWLALGASPREATREIARRASFSALVPVVDQTRTTGLVVLPGAFVGAIFGGLSPLEAGVFQILVLTAIIASGSIGTVLTLLMISPVLRKPVDELIRRRAN